MLIISILLIAIIVLIYIMADNDKWNYKTDSCFSYPNAYKPVYIKYKHNNVEIITLARLYPSYSLIWIPVNNPNVIIKDSDVLGWISKYKYAEY